MMPLSRKPGARMRSTAPTTFWLSPNDARARTIALYETSQSASTTATWNLLRRPTHHLSIDLHHLCARPVPGVTPRLRQAPLAERSPKRVVTQQTVDAGRDA